MSKIGQPWTAALVAALAIGSSATIARAQRHPHYDDRGTLTWFTTLAAAKEAARKANALIFVEVGTKT